MKLGKTNGYFAFCVGYKVAGSKSQHKFYLGKDEQQANLRATYVIEILRVQGGQVWSEPFLSIAKAVSGGAKDIEIDMSPVSPAFQVQELEKMQRELPFIRLRSPALVHQMGKAVWSQLAIQDLEKLRPELQDIIKTGSLGGLQLGANGFASLAAPNNFKLFEAFDSYIERDINAKNVNPESKKLNQYGLLRTKRVNRFKRDIKEMKLADMTLAQLNGEMCEKLCNYYRSRPLSRLSNQPISIKDAEHCIKELKRFFRWLNRAEEFNWSKPKGFEDVKFSIVKTNKERKIQKIVKSVYSIEELTILARHATDYDRMILFTCLNCSMGAAEIGRLEVGDILFNHNHEYAKQLVFESSTADNFIRYLRPKTGVFGEWLLWPETVEALCGAVTRAEDIGSDVVLCSDSGKPIYDDLASTNPQARFANKWHDLIKRVKKSHPDFRYLPFGSLRDTLADYIRHRYDGELASIGLAHGSPFKGDNLLECYSGKPFGRFHKAMRELHSLFMPVLTAPSAYSNQSKRYNAIEKEAVAG